jgi:hypothetical protein
MKTLQRCALVALGLTLPSVVSAQEVAPFFQQAPAVLVDTYEGVDAPVFNDYFEMLTQRYEGSDGWPWSIFTRSATKAIRVTALPAGLESMLEVLAARQASFQDFEESQVELWNSAWETRHVSVYNAAPGLSVVPDGFTGEDMQALPFTRVIVYELEWDQVPAFRAALRERSALDRAAGLGNAFVLTVWNGGIGTVGQTVVLRVSAESRTADADANFQARRAARQDYQAEWSRLTGIMNDAAASEAGALFHPRWLVRQKPMWGLGPRAQPPPPAVRVTVRHS